MPATLWSAFIFIVSLIPGNELPKEDWLDKIHFDKIVHAFLYFVFFLLVVRIFTTKGHVAILTASALCITQGILIELLQDSSFIQHRSFDLCDILANIAGVILAMLLNYNWNFSRNNQNF
jgi:VanZ family protein